MSKKIGDRLAQGGVHSGIDNIINRIDALERWRSQVGYTYAAMDVHDRDSFEMQALFDHIKENDARLSALEGREITGWNNGDIAIYDPSIVGNFRHATQPEVDAASTKPLE